MERSLLQAEAELAQFDAYGRALEEARREALAAEPECPPVPTTYNCVYEPEHPEADWAGLVPKEALYRKKHIPTRTVLQHDPEAGITTDPSVSRYGVRFDTRRIVQRPEQQQAPLLAGLDVDPNERWQTSYRQQTKGTPTPNDLYFESKRSVGKRHVAAAFESPTAPGRREAAHDGGAMPWLSARPSGGEEETLVGYRSGQASRSLLSGIGSKLVSSGITRPESLRKEKR